MPAPTRLRAIAGGSPAPKPPAPGAPPPPPPSANPAKRKPQRHPDRQAPRPPGLAWRLEAASRLLVEDVWSAWAIAGWLREIWPDASPAEAVARWLEETA